MARSGAVWWIASGGARPLNLGHRFERDEESRMPMAASDERREAVERFERMAAGLTAAVTQMSAHAAEHASVLERERPRIRERIAAVVSDPEEARGLTESFDVLLDAIRGQAESVLQMADAALQIVRAANELVGQRPAGPGSLGPSNN